MFTFLFSFISSKILLQYLGIKVIGIHRIEINELVVAPAEDELVEIEPAATSSTIGDEEIGDIVNDIITATEID